MVTASRYGNSFTIELRVRPEQQSLDTAEGDLAELSIALDTAQGSDVP